MITLDFETYSEAGYRWEGDKLKSLAPNNPGIKGVGAAVYAAHPSAEILSLAYDFDDGKGIRMWIPGMQPPHCILEWASYGQYIEAHNSGFEFLIWNLVGVRKYGWDPLPQELLRCSMAKALAYGLPAALANVAAVLGTEEQKDKEGNRLLRKFSIPRTPTKNNPNTRIRPEDDLQDFNKLISYNIQDVRTETAISNQIPDLIPIEQKIWHIDQHINQRGVHVDRPSVENCIYIIEQAISKYTLELQTITGGQVNSASEVARMNAWLSANGRYMPSLAKEDVTAALDPQSGISSECRRVLEIRQILGSSSVKKLYALSRYLMDDDRIRYLFMYYGGHTGRWAGRGPQLHNFPKGIPVDTVEKMLTVINNRDLQQFEQLYGDPLTAVSNCLRGLITAAPGADLICSDYSAIEAVVLAVLAGEQWRIDVFNTHGMIYEKSISMITGVSFQEILDYKKQTGTHHPLREKGKTAELASGFGGSIGAWKKFGADAYMSDDEILNAVRKWRKDSPMIPRFWYSIEEAAINAIRYPTNVYKYRGIKLFMETESSPLFIMLPSGRRLVYHQPRVDQVYKFDQYRDSITYMGWQDFHWSRIDTYGGKLTENIVQAVARDILAHAMVNLEAAGYPIVLHVHDEIGAEVLAGTGSIEHFEAIMSTMPTWAQGWPITAKGGWRGHRYRKD